MNDMHKTSRVNETQISQLIAVAKDAKTLYELVWRYTDPDYSGPALPSDVEAAAMYLGPEIVRLEKILDLSKIHMEHPGEDFSGFAIATWED